MQTHDEGDEDLGVTVAEATELLGLTRPAIENRKFPVARPGRPTLLSRRAVVTAYKAQREALETRLEGMKTAARCLGVEDLPTGDPGSMTEVANLLNPLLDRLTGLMDRLAEERAGRAAAEVRIDQLKADLRRANARTRRLQAAITDTEVDPDSALDELPP